MYSIGKIVNKQRIVCDSLPGSSYTECQNLRARLTTLQISENDIDDMTQTERERLYGVIAERLAAIGDSYTTNKQDLHAKSEPTSPRAKITVTAGIDTSYTSTDGKHLLDHLSQRLTR